MDGIISTHSAHEDGDVAIAVPQAVKIISTHSAHEDGDVNAIVLFPALKISTHSAHEDGDSNTTQKTNNSSSHFHNQITSYSLKSPPTYLAHIQNRSHCAVFPVRIPP